MSFFDSSESSLSLSMLAGSLLLSFFIGTRHENNMHLAFRGKHVLNREKLISSTSKLLFSETISVGDVVGSVVDDVVCINPHIQYRDDSNCRFTPNTPHSL